MVLVPRGPFPGKEIAVIQLLRTTAAGVLIAASLPALAGSPNELSEAERKEGFKLLFDGKSLAGWEGNPKFWSVEAGAIVGRTTKEHPTKGNTFLFWRKGFLRDFELRVAWKIEGGNSGIQYRSQDKGNWVAGGYQADIDASHGYTGILYEERGRGILARRRGDILSAIHRDGWNEYTIIARGTSLTQKINGTTTVEFTDEEKEKRALWGVLALQLHAGPPMTVRFRSIRLRPLAAAGPESLFDGTSMTGWKRMTEVNIPGYGKVHVEKGMIVLEEGSPMTGAVWQGDVPRNNYEVSLQAARLKGSDFFCGLTFPVGKEYCTLILGGWGGGTVGLSNVDHASAAENDTTQFMAFEEGQWYRVKVRVTDASIQAFLDDKQIINQERAGHTFTIWPEQDPARPLGITSYFTKAGLRNLKLQRLTSPK